MHGFDWNEATQRLEAQCERHNWVFYVPSVGLSGWEDDKSYFVLRNGGGVLAIFERQGEQMVLIWPVKDQSADARLLGLRERFSKG